MSAGSSPHPNVLDDLTRVSVSSAVGVLLFAKIPRGSRSVEGPSRCAAWSGSSADRLPRSAPAASTMAGYISTGQYLWGLHRLLGGITAPAVAGAQDDLVVAEGGERSIRQSPPVS